ncbi:hypothetical protein HOLleu_32294 [Holothuria leucospilota]|uniref:Uncharacterized protein n=1 Tax=Holothuria leucospilota TaxID=206669 RepID=A0A9Q1BGV4_HOLLE|nr:hypothetical protein HOLleu_32294 [Holothuria leucospilota]
MNHSTTQSMRRHGEERCKAVAGGLSSLEGELGEESFQDSGTGLANVTTGASSSSDPVEETGQTSTAGVTSKDQVTSESKDQPKRNSPLKEHSQTSEENASKIGGNKTKPNKAQSESAEDSVPVTPRKEQPKKASSHEDQAPTSEAGTSKEGIEKESTKPGSSDCSQESVPTTSSKEQPKGASTQKEQCPTSECTVGKEDSTWADPKVPTCDDKAIKTLSTASSKQQLETISAQKDQCTSNEDTADKTGCKGRDQESSKEDQIPISVAVGGKTEGKDKESGKPSLSDHGENSFQVTSSKEQTRPVLEKEENKPSSFGLSADFKKTDHSVIASEEQVKKQPVEEDDITACEGKVLQNPFSDLVTKTVSTTSGKEQSQKKLALQDQREACAVVGNEKEPKRSSSDNAKENNPTTPGDKQARRELAPEHLDQIDEAGAGKKTSIENEPKSMGQGSDIDKKDASTLSSKKELAQNGESPLYKSDGGTKDYFLLDSKDNGKMELSDETPESTKKAPSGKRYSLMRHPRNKTQPAAKPSEPESGVKDQIVEKLPEKMDSMERAEKKPEKGKQANTVAKAEEAASIPSQEEFPTISVEGPTAEVTKPNIVTVQALSESKTPESLDEKSQKEAKLVEPLTEISQNVLVRHTRCISSNKMGLCVRQKFSTFLSTIVEETLTELANVATLDEEKVTGSLQPSQGQPNINFPTTQEADSKDSVGCHTKLSASSPAFVPRTATPILQPPGTNPSGNPQTAYMYHPATQAALVASSPVQQGTTDNTPTYQSRMQKSVPMRYQQEAPTKQQPQMSTSSVANNLYSATPVMQQQPNISPAVNHKSTPVVYMNPEQLAAHSVMAVSPVQQGPSDSMPPDQLRVQMSVPVRHQQEVCITELPQMSAAYTTCSTALAMQQHGYIPLNVNLGSTPVLYMYPEQLADYLSMAVSPVQQDNMPTDQLRMQKSVPVRHQQEEQHGSTIPAGSHQLETCVNGPPILPSGNATYQSCDYHVPSIKTEMGYVSTPSNIITTCTPSQQQVVEPHMHKRFPFVSLGVPPTHNTQPTIGTPGLKQDMQRTPHMTSSQVVSKTRAPKESAVPSPNSIPNAAASHMKQHINTDCAVQVLQKKDQNGSTTPAGSHQLETCINGPPTLPPGIAAYQSCDYHVPSIKTATRYVSTPSNIITTCTPSQQQFVEKHIHKRFPIVSLRVPPTHNTQPTIGTPGLKQDMQRTPHMTSSQAVSKKRAPKESAVPSPNSIPNAAASHVEQHINMNRAVQVLQKNDQLTSPKVVPVTNAPEKTTSLTICNTSKAAAPLKHQQSKTTLAVQEDVQKKSQVTFPKVVSNTSTPQEEAPSVSIKAKKTLVTDNEQPNNTCHSELQICSSQQAVRPKERGLLAKAQSYNTVETSATGQIGSRAKSKLSRSTKRRRARGRQRERQRAAEAERREAEAEKEEEAAEQAAAVTVKETEGADSSNQGLEASSSSNEIILNPDDLYYAVNWETEAARPLHNSTLIVTACNTPKAAAPLKHQQSQTTVAAVKEDGLKNDQLTSPKVVPVTNAPEKTTSPTACNTPKAAAPLKHQQSQTTVAAVKEDGLKNDQLTSPKVVPVTSAPEKTTSPTACNTPKAAAPLKHQQSKTTLAVQEDVLKKGQVTFPKVVSNTNTPQEEAPSVSINATEALVTDNEQPNNTCHSQSQICLFQQAVRPKERGPLAKAQSCNTVETSAAGQTGSTAKPKLSRSTKRRRARGRQRERQRAAEAERREAETEKEEAAEGAAAITVKETEGADSSNQGLEASSSSNEIILNPDDLYYAGNWETEAARPLHNSVSIV